MKHSSLFRLLTMITVFLYCTVLTQAGQVITEGKRQWASEAIQQEQDIAPPASPHSIGVLNFVNKSGSSDLDPLQKGMAVMLITDLSKVGEIQVVERTRMQALLDEMELGTTGLVDNKTAPRLGRLLGVFYLTGGDILKGREQDLEIDPALLDVPSENIIEPLSATGVLEDIFTLEKEILFNIIDELGVHITPEEEVELRKPLTTSLAALLALFLGIDLSDKEQYTEAANMYEQALLEDPNFKIADGALQELKDMGLTAVNEASMLEEATPPPEVAGELSMIAKVGIGAAAVAAAVGAGYLAAEESSDSDSSSNSSTETGGELSLPNISSVAPGEGASLSCTGGSLNFSFSQPMLQSGEVMITAADTPLSNFFSDQRWLDAQNFAVSWSHSPNNQYCYDDSYDTVSSITITLSNFVDTEGFALSGIRNLYYDGKLFRHGSVDF